jgi:subtilisin family serine protease
MLIKLIMGTAMALSGTGNAATVAILDSGTDWEHQELAKHIWHNEADMPDNDQDDDGDGYVDDVRGWNFADSNNQILDRSFIGTFSDDCYKYFEVQGRIIRGEATEEDKAWIKEKKEDPSFLQELSTFGNFVHGTHVSGIASTSRTKEILLIAKIISTGSRSLVTPEFAQIKAELEAAENDDPLTDLLVQWYIGQLVDQQIGLVADAGNYVVRHKADVVNGSFGISYAAAEKAVKALLQAFGGEATDEKVRKYALYLIGKVNDKCRDFVKDGKNTLFVWAAGNDGTDNDEQPMAPANVSEANSISVAATQDGRHRRAGRHDQVHDSGRSVPRTVRDQHGRAVRHRGRGLGQGRESGAHARPDQENPHGDGRQDGRAQGQSPLGRHRQWGARGCRGERLTKHASRGGDRVREKRRRGGAVGPWPGARRQRRLRRAVG